MEDIRTSMLCDRCRRPVALDLIRYVPRGSGRVALCPDCLGTGESMPSTVKLSTTKGSTSSTSSTSSKKPFVCVRCNFKFKAVPSVSRCPYCGKADKVMEDALHVNTLLKESEGF